MKNKLVLCIIFLILCSISVSAGWKEIHNDWHGYDDDFVLDGIVHQLTLNENANKKGEYERLLVKAEGITTIVWLGKCQSKDEYKYCFENETFDSSKAQIKSNGIAMPAVKLVIYEDEALAVKELSLKNEYEIDKKTLVEVPITLTIENEGNEWVKNINYAIDLPENIKVINQYNYKWDGKQRLVLSFTLSPGESRDFLLTVVPQTFELHQINYSLTYVLESGSKEKSGDYKLDLSAPFKVSGKLSNTAPGIGEKIYYDVSVENQNTNNPLNIEKLTLQGPTNFDYIPIKNLKFEKVGFHASSKNSILAGKSEEFRLALTTKSEGKNNVTLRYAFEIEGETFESELVSEFSTEEKSLEADLYLNRDEVLPGEDVRLDLVIHNLDDSVSFKDLTFEINSDLFKETINVPLLDPLTEKRITITEFIAPITEEDEEYEFVGTLKYFSDTSYQFSKEAKVNLKVTGSGEIVKLSQTVNQTKAKPGDEILVTVSVENLKDQQFDNIQFFEQYPRQIELVTGNTQRNINLENKESEQVYIYKLKIPDLYKTEIFNITTTMVMADLGYSKKLIKTIEVEIPEDLFVESTDDEPEEVVETKPKVKVNNQESEKDKGFFENLFDSIDKFFSGLFGG
ncbi:hypothetical protein K9L67_03175 [Candidatus Woesearchaeota archaeon]|nr:hypothetical protein [Candidatus Woesearchaeota archaeon]MCF7901204.1 hypothetical protein [Candidatus Woesearchaeota archaeon]MCF8013701.1 hypothetical protein [Candidatus Woesearchaeota archaeon]